MDEHSTKITILLELIKEDRAEIRMIKNSISNILILLLTLNFTAALYLDKFLLIYADISIISLIIIYWFVRNMDLKNCRKSLEMREGMLMDTYNGSVSSFDPFKSSNSQRIKLKSTDINLAFLLAIMVVIAKTIAIYSMNVSLIN